MQDLVHLPFVNREKEVAWIAYINITNHKHAKQVQKGVPSGHHEQVTSRFIVFILFN
jgi:hypothetical protein